MKSSKRKLEFWTSFRLDVQALKNLSCDGRQGAFQGASVLTGCCTNEDVRVCPCHSIQKLDSMAVNPAALAIPPLSTREAERETENHSALPATVAILWSTWASLLLLGHP